MTVQRSHYDILGVKPNASTEEIKKRYRELARTYHPDRNPNTAKLFSDITASYKVLSDPESRATYDAEQALKQRERATGSGKPSASRNPFDTTPPPRKTTPRPAGNDRPPSRNGTTTSEEMRLVSEAQSAFARGNFVSARALCEQIMRLNGRNAQAYEILGDIYRVQGKSDDAIRMYTIALQLNPRNPSLQERFDRLAKGRIDFRQAPVPGNPVGPGFRSGPPGGTRPVPKRTVGGMLGNVIGYGLVFLVVVYVAMFAGPPFDPREQASLHLQWNWIVIAALAVCGIVLGVTLACTNTIARLSEELKFNPFAGGKFQLPMGLLLLVVCSVNFWAGAVLYILLGVLRESLGISMMRVFSAVAMTVLLIAGVFEPGRLTIAAVGGNIVFLGMLFGWWIGDFFRQG